MIDKDEYPQTAELETRCVNILADLWHAPERERGDRLLDDRVERGRACSAGMALKRRWRKRREAAGKPADKPNIVMGANVQVCWEKFANYWDVEPRLVPMEGEPYHLDAGRGRGALRREHDRRRRRSSARRSTAATSRSPRSARRSTTSSSDSGLDVPVHVDGASGGFIAPFLDPDLVWDFRLPRVASINTSGHKYGLVYPGVGWVVWRDADALPDDLIFHVNYLGGDDADVRAQLLAPGRPGRRAVLQLPAARPRGLPARPASMQGRRPTISRPRSTKLGPFEMLNDGSDMPLVTWTLKDGYTDTMGPPRPLGQARERGWQVPAYRCPPTSRT